MNKILIIIFFLCIGAAIAAYADEKNKFMEGCKQDMKEYECILMWRQK